MARGSSVSDLTRISPRTPCGAPKTPRRIRRSGARNSSQRSGRGGFGGLGGGRRSCGCALLGLLLRLRLLRIVAGLALGEPKAVEQAEHAVGRLRALGEPRLGLFLIEHEAGRVVLG